MKRTTPELLDLIDDAVGKKGDPMPVQPGVTILKDVRLRSWGPNGWAIDGPGPQPDDGAAAHIAAAFEAGEKARACESSSCGSGCEGGSC